MAAVLTLHGGSRQGGRPSKFDGHPVEIARQALLQAGELEDEPSSWRMLYQQLADALPERTGRPYGAKGGA